ncbi:hypothetical protein QE152_g1959 [Popillia japonica]|uniref:Uncharacterized protein n=1 Tax=Popillia japonica TaxID=7064 RepID=A0AAW1N7Q1_POPJA
MTHQEDYDKLEVMRITQFKVNLTWHENHDSPRRLRQARSDEDNAVEMVTIPYVLNYMIAKIWAFLLVNMKNFGLRQEEFWVRLRLDILESRSETSQPQVTPGIYCSDP